MNSPIVSIITPTKNRRALLEEAMDSVAAQTLVGWEHLIVDDGSDDGTAEVVARRASSDPRIRYIRRVKEQGGANICRNIGIRESLGEYLLFLDSDDLLAPGCLERRSEILQRNQDLDFVVFRTVFFVNKVGDLGYGHAADISGDDLVGFLTYEAPWIITGPLWRKSSLVDVAGLFDEDLLSWQDIELHVRAITKGLRYVRFPEIDHFVRWDNSVRRVSADQRKSPRHLAAAAAVLEKLEKHVRGGPGMNWIRQRALCSLYFFVAEHWAEIGRPMAAIEAWNGIRRRKLGRGVLFWSGVPLVLLKAMGLPTQRLTRKWQGWMRLRVNPSVV